MNYFNDDGTIRRETTAELLASLKEHYEHFDLSEWDEGDSAYNHEQVYLMAKDVSETLDIWEIQLIYFLRFTHRTHDFFKIAQKLYNSEYEYLDFVRDMKKQSAKGVQV